MGWMQKKINTPSITSYYSLNSKTPYLLVGLGNPGKKYENNYHNVGFLCLDDFVSKNSQEWHKKDNFNAEVAEFFLNDNRIISIKPQTFMNNSGQAVKKVADYYKVNKNKIVIIHDDFDLEFGTIRTRYGGSSGGHNGVDSIIELLGEDFNRIRIGIKSSQIEGLSAGDIVLHNFPKDQQNEFMPMFKEVGSIINEFIFSQSEIINSETRKFILN